MTAQTARSSVIADHSEKLTKGMEGVRFFTGDVVCVTEDNFYEQADKLNIAILSGKARPLSFNDSRIGKTN